MNPECLVDISNISTAKTYLLTWEGQERFKAIVTAEGWVELPC